MALRHDALYTVDLVSPQQQPRTSSSPNAPPPVLQLRLTEHALTQLAAALCPDGVSLDPAKLPPDLLRLQLGPSATNEAALCIGPSRLPLQRSVETAPHEVYRLNDDETQLTRVGTVTHKLSVRPTQVTAGAASRLKERQEEEDLRKERKRAVVVDQPITASKLKQQRGASSSSSKSSAISSAALSRSASLNKINLIRQESRQDRPVSLSPLRGRETPSQPNSAAGSPIINRPAPSSLLSSPEAKAAPLGTSQWSRLEQTQQRRSQDPDAVQDSGVSDSDSISSPPKSRAGPLRSGSTATAGGGSSSAAAAASASAAKKTSKLSTRDRLTKAAKGKGGGRPLAETAKKPSSATIAKPVVKASTPSSSRVTAAPEGDSGETRAKARAEASRLPPSVPVKPVINSTSSSKSSGDAAGSAARGPAVQNALPPKPATVTRSVSPSKVGDRASRSPTRVLESELPRKRARGELEGTDAIPESRSRPPLQRTESIASARRATPSVSPAPRSAPSLPAETSGPSPQKRQRRLSPPDVPQAPSASAAAATVAMAAPQSATASRSPSPPIPLLPTVKGVGPGAAHWIEPWLDVRSRADWHRLAARFSKTCDEYSVNKRRLDEERSRLDREWTLAVRDEGIDEDACDAAGDAGGLGIVMDDAAAAAARSPRAGVDNLVGRSRPALREAREGGQEAEEGSLEEGEMGLDMEASHSLGVSNGSQDASLDPDRERERERDHASALGLTNAGGSESSSRTRSASPEDCLVWRSDDPASRSNTTSPPLSRDGSAPSTAGGAGGGGGAAAAAAAQPPPLPFKELEALAERHRDLHGSLKRMQSVLVQSKARFQGSQ